MHRLRAQDRMGRGLPFIDLHSDGGFYPPVGVSIMFKTKKGEVFNGEAVRTNDDLSRSDVAFYASEHNKLYLPHEVISWQVV